MCKIQLSVKYIVHLLVICCECMQIYATCTVHTASVLFYCLFVVIIVQNTNQGEEMSFYSKTKSLVWKN